MDASSGIARCRAEEREEADDRITPMSASLKMRLEGDTCWVIDYKVVLHDLNAGLLAVESERHLAQLERYATLMQHKLGKAVQIALYFPLQDLWWATAWQALEQHNG